MNVRNDWLASHSAINVLYLAAGKLNGGLPMYEQVAIQAWVLDMIAEQKKAFERVERLCVAEIREVEDGSH